jgi:hypothetical protein
MWARYNIQQRLFIFSKEPVSSKTASIWINEVCACDDEEPLYSAAPIIVEVEKEIKVFTWSLTWWTEWTYKKQELLMSYGMGEIESRDVIDRCKVWPNAWRCVVLSAHVYNHESAKWTSYAANKYNNPYWLKRNGDHMYFDARIYAFYRRYKSYEKYRYKNSCREMVTRSKYTATQQEPWINNCEWMQRQFDKLNDF